MALLDFTDLALLWFLYISYTLSGKLVDVFGFLVEMNGNNLFAYSEGRKTEYHYCGL